MNCLDKKKEQLGVSLGTAAARLRKNIMFNLAKKAGDDFCFRCGKKIETVEEFSIEHKLPWLDSETPVELFFDLNNIAFSHLGCNVGSARRVNKKYANATQRRAARYLRAKDNGAAKRWKDKEKVKRGRFV